MEENPPGELHIWLYTRHRQTAAAVIAFVLACAGIAAFLGMHGFWEIMSIRETILLCFGFSVALCWGMWIVYGRSSIHVNSLGVVVVKKLFGISRRTVIPLEALEDISVKESDSPVYSMKECKLVIRSRYGHKSVNIGGGLSPGEANWIAYGMGKFLEKLREDIVFGVTGENQMSKL